MREKKLLGKKLRCSQVSSSGNHHGHEAKLSSGRHPHSGKGQQNRAEKNGASPADAIELSQMPFDCDEKCIVFPIFHSLCLAGIQIRRNLFGIQSRFFEHMKSYDYKFKSLGKSLNV